MRKQIQDLNIIQKLPIGKHECWCEIVVNPLAQPINIPVLIIKGANPGATIGLTAAVHGNEINGIPVIQRLFQNIEPERVQGTIVGIPVVNIPSFERKKRRFVDGRDLNHFFPGKKDGNMSQVYAFRFFNRIVKYLDYLMDLHTASFGRINSYYIRADLMDPVTKKMALLQNAQIIVHNPANDGTLRGAASNAGIPAITLEVGNPNLFQKGMIRSSLTGVFNTLHEFDIYPSEIDLPVTPAVLCKDSYWLYTKTGGVLQVYPQLAEMVEKGKEIAIMKDIFGNRIVQYTAPEKGVVIGKSISPVNQTGGRILHLGKLWSDEEE